MSGEPRDPEDDDELERDLAAFGLDPERAAASGMGGDSAEPGDTFEVWPENADAVDLFVALQTQWRVAAGMSALVITGLDYAAVEAAMRMRGVKDRRAMFAAIRTMESAALPALNRQADGD